MNRNKLYHFAIVLQFVFLIKLSAQETPLQINGVFPKMTVKSDITNDMSEAGIGAMITWADKLWVVGYVAHVRGSGVGLYEVSDDMSIQMHPLSFTGTFANRFIHEQSLQALIGPYLIDSKGKVRILEDLKRHRITATMAHLSKPDSMVYYLTMEGMLYETNVYNLRSKFLCNLVKELKIDSTARIHFKGGFTSGKKVYVANNSYYEEEYLLKREAGRLAEWDGSKWVIIDRNPYVEISGKHWGADFYGNSLFATGWDRSSAILKFLKNGVWKTYRLPKASYAYDHAWNTEWMRIREANTERFLMDLHGIFYEIPTISYQGNIMGIRPISNHLRIVPDFIHWRGMFVMGSDQADKSTGQPQSGLWFGNMDDLWSFGKPKGVGGPWYESNVRHGEVSDPYLMNGFDKKTLHITNNGHKEIEVTIYVDYLSNDTWNIYKTFKVAARSYAYHVFEDGFSAQWLKAKVNLATEISLQLTYN